MGFSFNIIGIKRVGRNPILDWEACNPAKGQFTKCRILTTSLDLGSIYLKTKNGHPRDGLKDPKPQDKNCYLYSQRVW